LCDEKTEEVIGKRRKGGLVKKSTIVGEKALFATILNYSGRLEGTLY
jgi:hypothetical protein